jgi:AAA family ATP:ADP antiporter
VWLHRIAPLEPGEGRAVLWSAAFHFCLLGGYYMLRPVREAFGIERGADRLPWLMTATLVAMLLVNPLFAALVSRVPRRRFVPITYRFFATNLVVFYALFRLLPAGAVPWLGYAFYVWLSVFNLFVVSVY